jgi:hypothetical protein
MSQNVSKCLTFTITNNCKCNFGSHLCFLGEKGWDMASNTEHRTRNSRTRWSGKVGEREAYTSAVKMAKLYNFSSFYVPREGGH